MQTNTDPPKEIRVRVAPSPTGPLHLGTARTALFNWLFAKHNNGKFILRVDDSDRNRSEEKWEKSILNGLTWLGLNWDEGPIISGLDSNQLSDQKALELEEGYIGEYGPYHQSKRLDIYEKYLKRLIDMKLAYPCFCKPEELEAERQAMISAGQVPKYSGRCRSLSEEEIKKKIANKEKFVIRIKVPEKRISFVDMIRGKIEFDLNLIGDFIIAKSMREPLYNFASVVDDYEMKITHVIRGEDHISNTPKQIIIQELLSFPKVKYAHIPLLLNQDRSKLSKRKNPISIDYFKEEGYLPEALINFLSLLGWHPEGEQEFIKVEKIIEEFDLGKVQKSPAIFLSQKLDWLNSKYIRSMEIEKLVKLAREYIDFSKTSEIKVIIDQKYLESVLSIFKERLTKISEIKELSVFFFKKPRYHKNLLFWKEANSESTILALKKIKRSLEKINEEDWSKDRIEDELNSISSAKNKGGIFWPFRVALSGKKSSPPGPDIASIIGKEETLERIKEGIKRLEEKISSYK